MKENILIVEDEFIVADDLRITLVSAGYHVCGIGSSVNEARDLVKNEHPSIVLLDIHLKGKLSGIDLAKELREKDIPFIYLSANSNQQILETAKATEPYGFLVKPYRERDLLVALDIARYRYEYGAESRVRREQALQSRLNAIIAEGHEWDQTFLQIAKALQSQIPFDYLTGVTKTEELKLYGLGFLRVGFDEYQQIGMNELMTISGLKSDDLWKLFEISPQNYTASWYNGSDFENACLKNPLKKKLSETFDLRSSLAIPLLMASGGMFTITFFSRKPHSYNEQHLSLLFRIQQLITIGLDNLIAFKKTKPFKEDDFIKIADGVQGAGIISNFEGIIGSSPALLSVLDQASQVAPLETSVLLLGESGTGKEKMAQSIHSLSPKKSKAFIKVNCGALPSSLIESELFGHEKGSFTGATDKRIGKFEQADGGTIFLDEIGELPPDLQVKLLRVLQEKEIERIGGKAPIKIDVRIIAATNRNLEKEIAERRFRLDLYYRLNVFPIQLPSLRERKEDIKQLSHFFAVKCCDRIKKKFNGISAQMMDELETYHWPGNIRELENVIEQAVILNEEGAALSLKRPLSTGIPTMAKSASNATGIGQAQSLTDIKKIQEETPREYIISMLRKTNGRIRGEGGAAQLLNLKPTTLESRMLKLGIRKENL